jgi:UDP-N-acetylglucosamine:LPS N-acetylglucosamine transferase
MGQPSSVWPRRVLFVCSSGGHLAQLHRLRPWWTTRERRWVTFGTTDARSLLRGEDTVWAHHPTTRNLPNLVRNLGLAARQLRAYRPDLVVSDGAAVAFPFFLAAQPLRIPCVYLEVLDRIDSRTLTGRLCAPLADLFLVQSPRQQPLYAGSHVVGELL